MKTTPQHTPTPWNLHQTYCRRNAPGVAIPEGGGEPWLYQTFVLAAGDKIVGEIKYSTAPGGFPKVDSLAEARANLDLVLRAVNRDHAYEPMREALADLLAEIGPNTYTGSNVAVTKARAALALAEKGGAL